MQEERRHAPDEQLNMRRRKDDAKFETTQEDNPANLKREVWSPLEFDKKYLEIAERFLNDEDTDKAA